MINDLNPNGIQSPGTGYYHVKVNSVQQKYITEEYIIENTITLIQVTIIKHLSKIVSVVHNRRTPRQACRMVQATMQACTNSCPR